ncbi:phage tail protein, partial [Escherichia coli]
MSTKFYTLLTDIGAAKLASATALGVPLKITHMAVGDGGGVLPTPDAKQTALVNEKRRAALNMLYIDPQNSSQIIAEQVIPENEGGWWIREVGLFDESGALIAVGNCPESYKPQLAEGSGRTQTVRMVLITSSTDNIILKIDPAVVLATRKYVDDKISEHEQSRRHPDASLTAKGFTQLSSATNSESEILAATPKAVKAAYDLAAGKASASHTHPWSQITDVPAASLTVKGTVQLSSATNSTSETQAATPKAVKAVYDLANGKQPADATLTALAGLATAADKLPYFTGNDTASLTTLTNVGRNILDKASTQAVIQYLGLSDASGYVGRWLNTRVFTSSGTYTTTPGTKRIRVTITGGGGGGGG